MRRALLTAANRSFFPGVRALLAGAARHHPDIPRWCFVPSDSVEEANQHFGQYATILTAPRPIAGIPEDAQICLARLFASILPADVIAYIDADAVLCRPAPELWDVPAGKWNVVADSARTVLSTVPLHLRTPYERQFPKVGNEKGFNSGVIAFRTAEWTHLPELFENTFKAGEYDSYHPIFDQPLLNGMIQPHTNWLPFDFNVNNLFDNRIPRTARIVHFTGGRCKPWDARYPRHEPQYYWWLRHGLNEQRISRLLAARLLILVVTPKRLLGRALRRLSDRQRAPVAIAAA